MRSEEWQFQYLKAAAHLFAFVRHIGQKRTAPPPATTTVEENHSAEEVRTTPSDEAFSTLSRVVVRYQS